MIYKCHWKLASTCYPKMVSEVPVVVGGGGGGDVKTTWFQTQSHNTQSMVREDKQFSYVSAVLNLDEMINMSMSNHLFSLVVVQSSSVSSYQ